MSLMKQWEDMVSVFNNDAQAQQKFWTDYYLRKKQFMKNYWKIRQKLFPVLFRSWQTDLKWTLFFSAVSLTESTKA